MYLQLLIPNVPAVTLIICDKASLKKNFLCRISNVRTYPGKNFGEHLINNNLTTRKPLLILSNTLLKSVYVTSQRSKNSANAKRQNIAVFQHHDVFSISFLYYHHVDIVYGMQYQTTFARLNFIRLEGDGSCSAIRALRTRLQNQCTPIENWRVKNFFLIGIITDN